MGAGIGGRVRGKERHDLSFVVEWMQFRMVRTTARDKNPENPARTALAAPAGPIRLAQVTR